MSEARKGAKFERLITVLAPFVNRFNRFDATILTFTNMLVQKIAAQIEEYFADLDVSTYITFFVRTFNSTYIFKHIFGIAAILVLAFFDKDAIASTLKSCTDATTDSATTVL